MPQDPMDCILMEPESLHHSRFNQTPLLALPTDLAQNVRMKGLAPLQFKSLNEREEFELSKTAEVVAKGLWNLFVAKTLLGRPFCRRASKTHEN